MAGPIFLAAVVILFLYWLIRDVFITGIFIHNNRNLSPVGFQVELDYAYGELRRMLQFIPEPGFILDPSNKTMDFARTIAGQVIQKHPLVLKYPEIWNAVTCKYGDHIQYYVRQWIVLYARYMTAMNGRAPYCLSNPELSPNPVRIPGGTYWPIQGKTSLANKFVVSEYDSNPPLFQEYDNNSDQYWSRRYSKKRKPVTWAPPAGAPYYEWKEKDGKDFVALAEWDLPKEYLDWCKKQIQNHNS